MMNTQTIDVAPLCDVCRTLGLSSTNNREPAEYSLGTSKEIKRKAEAPSPCPFCVLVKSFIGKSGKDEVSIRWKEEGGFFYNTGGDNLTFLNEDTATSPYGSARPIQSIIDPNLMKKWMNLCEVNHEEACTPKRGVIRTSASEVGVKVLRLINTKDECIVEAAPGDRYLALSYVWGPVVPSVRLQTDTLADLSTKGVFRSFQERLPKTIRDAIYLVQLIGERYLWVDSLCLIQDNDEDMLDGISHMDLVYQCAMFTIIAAHGEDANAGLPGLHHGSRDVKQHIVEVLPDIKMTATTGVYNAMRGVHSTRGWTMQELVLSHRTIVFTKDCIYFRCRTNCWSEDTIYDNFPSAVNRVLHSGGQIHFLDDNESATLAAYNTQLFRYADRNMTKESDTIHGFTGILHFLSVRTRTGILEGLFTSSFDICLLCWDNFPRASTPARRSGFPSWSWAGWEGIRDGYGRFCKDPDSVNVWLQTQTYIVWYKRSPGKAELELVWDLDAQLKYGIPEKHHIGYRSDLDNPYGRSVDELLEDLKTRPDNEDIQRTNIIQKEMEKRKYHFLHFFAYTVSIEGFADPPKSSAWAMLYGILGAGKTKCGGIKFDNQKLMKKTKGPHELVLLSKMDKYEDFFNDTIMIERPFYWVMFIVWTGSEKVVAERRGIGFLFQDCMEHVLPPGKVWKEIVLA